MSESELIVRAQGGDVAAFETLVQKYDRKVLGFALNLLKNQDDARDAYQEIFLKAFQALPRFRRESQFSTWLYRIAYHTCVSYLRRRHHTPTLTWPGEGDTPSPGDWPDADQSNPEKKVLQKEFFSVVQNVVATFSPKRQTIFYLRYQNDLSLKDISAATGLSLSAVKNHLFKIHEKLRNELKGYGEVYP